MTNIILDTNILIAYPKLLGLSIADKQFIVPLGVVAELNEIVQKGKVQDSVLDLIQKGSLDGTITILNDASPLFRRYHEEFRLKNYTGSDLSVVATALALKSQGQNSKIATLDKVVEKIARHNEIEIVSKDEIEIFIHSFKKPVQKPKTNIIFEILLETIKQILNLTPIFGNLFDPVFKSLKEVELPSIQGRIIFFERKENVNLFVGINMGILCTLLGILIYSQSALIVSTINVWGTITLIIILGIILFIIRERQRLGYGVFEFLVGIVSVIAIFYSYEFDYSKIDYNPDFYLKIAAGLYIMVRGQDNIVKATNNSKFGLKLQKFGIGLT